MRLCRPLRRHCLLDDRVQTNYRHVHNRSDNETNTISTLVARSGSVHSGCNTDHTEQATSSHSSSHASAFSQTVWYTGQLSVRRAPAGVLPGPGEACASAALSDGRKGGDLFNMLGLSSRCSDTASIFDHARSADLSGRKQKSFFCSHYIYTNTHTYTPYNIHPHMPIANVSHSQKLR